MAATAAGRLLLGYATFTRHSALWWVDFSLPIAYIAHKALLYRLIDWECQTASVRKGKTFFLLVDTPFVRSLININQALTDTILVAALYGLKT
jgi:hypothetical protein